MTINLKSFLKNFEGKWLLQKNIYLLTNKKQTTGNDVIEVLLKNDFTILNKINAFYSYNFDSWQPSYSYKISSNNLKYNTNNVLNPYKLNVNLKFVSSSLLKIYCEVINKSLIYEEYLYSVNNNFKLSIGILKNLRYKKYIATIVTSYIKLL